MSLAQEFDPAINIAMLHEHPENPRIGDDAAVSESIDENGWWGAILVQRSTGFILGGNTRFRVMKEAGETDIPGFWIDCDDTTAKKILLADNRTSDLAFYDDAALVSLLQSVKEVAGSIVGTGYDDDAYALLLAQTLGSGSGNSVGGTPAGDRQADYEASELRSIVLQYPNSEYDDIVAGLATLRALHDVDTNAEVVAILIGNAAD